MTNSDPRLDETRLNEVIVKLLRSTSARAASWDIQSLSGSRSAGSSIRLFRIQGEALDGGAIRPWRALLEVSPLQEDLATEKRLPGGADSKPGPGETPSEIPCSGPGLREIVVCQEMDGQQWRWYNDDGTVQADR